MANVLSAAAKAASDRVSSSIKDAKDHVINQIDPRNSIYQLGLGVGPLIRQTVAEYNKQQNKNSKKEAAKSETVLVDIKKTSQKSTAGITQLSARMEKMNNLLTEIKTINLAQLRAQRQSVFAERAGDAMSLYKLVGAKPNGTDADASPKAKEEGKGLMSVVGDMITSPAGMTMLATVAGGLIFQNREAIGKFIDNFLKAAGLPTKEELAEDMKTEIKGAVVTVAGLVAEGLVGAVKGLIPFLAKELKDRTLETFGMRDKVDQAGNPTGETMPARPAALGEPLGALAGGAIGAKAPGKWKLLTMPLGALMGAAAGEEAPEATIAGTAVAGALALKGKFGAASKIAGGAADDVARAATAVKPPAAATGAVPGFLTEFGTVGANREIAKNIGQSAEAGAGSFGRVVDFVKEMTNKLTDKAAALLSTSKDAVAGVAEAAEQSAAMTGAKAVGKKIIGGGAIGGVLSAGMDYAQNKDLLGAAISGTLNVLLGGGGAVLGSFGGPVGTFAGGVGGGLLADYLANQINGWRRGGQGGVQGVNLSSTLGNTPRFQTVAYNRPQETPAGADGNWSRVDPTTGASSDERPYLNPIEGGRVTGHVGESRGDHTHAGTDIAGPRPGMTGVAVKAIADGFIETIDSDSKSGNYVVLRHSGDNNTSLYMHLESILVRRKQRISKGDVLGIMGKTGSASGAHLHLEIRKGGVKGDQIDPETMIAGLNGSSSTSGQSLARDQNINSLRMTESQIADIAGRNATLNKFKDIANLLPMMLDAGAGGGGGAPAPANPGGGANRATPGNGTNSNAKDRMRQNRVMT